MKVPCPSCPAQYDIDESRIPAAGIKLKCPKCKTVFPVERSGQQSSAEAVPLPGQDAPSAGGGEGSVPLPGGGAPEEPAAGGGEGTVPLPGGGAPEEPGAGGGEGTVPLPGGGAPEEPAAGGGEGTVPLPGGGAPEEPAAADPAAASMDFGNVSFDENVGAAGSQGDGPSALDEFGNVDIGGMEGEGFEAPSDPAGGFDPFADTGGDAAPSAGAPSAPDAAPGEFDPFADTGGDAAPSAGAPSAPDAAPGEFDPFADAGPDSTAVASPPPLSGSGEGDDLAFDPGAAPSPQGGDDLSFDPEQGDEEDLELSFDEAAAPAPAPAPKEDDEDLEVLDFIDEQYDSAKTEGAKVRAAGPTRFRVKRKSGKTFGPFDSDVVVSMLKEGQLLGNEEVSTDGTKWKPIGSVPAFQEAIQALMEAPAPEEAAPVVPAVQDDDEEDVDETARKGKGYGVFSMSPSAAARRGRPREAALRAIRKRWKLIAGASAAIAVLSFGVYLGFTPYGWFGYRMVFTHGLGERDQASEELLLDAREGIASGTYRGYVDALESARAALELDGRDVEARSIFAQAAFYLERRYGGYDAEVRRAAEYLRETEVTAGDYPEHVKAAMGRAILEGREAEHRSALKRVVEEDPDDLEAFYLLGESYFGERDHEKAAEYLDRMVVAQPDNAKAFHALGYLHSLLDGPDDRELAKMFFQRALEADSNHLESALELAQIQLGAREPKIEEAEETLALITDERARHLSPEERARGYYLEGVLLTHKRELEEAFEAFEAGLELADDSYGRAAYGRALWRAGNLDEAIEQLGAAASADPENISVGADHVEAMIQAGRVLDATRALEDFERRAGQDARVPFLKGLLAWSQEELEDAERYLRTARSRDEDFHRAPLALGRLYLELRRVSRAEEPLRAAVESAPRAPDAHVGLGEYFLEIHRPQEAIESFENALELDDEIVEAVIGMARAHTELGDDEEAVAAFERAAEIEPDNHRLAFHRGSYRWAQGELEEAREDLAAAHDQDPTDPAIRARLGAVLYDLGRVNEAGRHLQAAATGAGNVGETFYYLGLVLAQQGDRRAGLDRIRRAIRIEPENSRFLFALGELHEDGREYTDALYNYERAIELDPRYVEAHLRMGDVHALLNRYSDAIQAYRKAYDLDPENADTIMKLADTYVTWGKAGDAVPWYDRAVALDPEIEGVHIKQARALQTIGNHQRAVQAFQAAARHQPDDPTPHYHLGYAHKDQGENSLAKRHFRHFMDRADEDHPHYREVEDELFDLGG